MAALRDNEDPRRLEPGLRGPHPRRRRPRPARRRRHGPAHYALYIEARRRDDSRDGFTLLRLGPYTQTRHAKQDYDRITAALDGRETTLVPGHRVSARFAPFDVSDHHLFADPYDADAVALLAATIEGATA
ncbi:hypothetical protein ACP4I1_33615 [Streptomyces sp. WG4]|uniref:hypothetical protein n=1 Tax=Streptomyces sp. WG4 TaxID=3417649 RepID=UPI003CF33F4B